MNDTGAPSITWNIRIRSVLFFILYNLVGIIHSFFCILIGPFLPFKKRYAFVNLWTHVAMWLLRVINGVHIQVEGRQNLPDYPAVVLCNHQSSWETFYLQLLISPQATVLKKELLWLPFFGWGVALLNPIKINRKDGKAALKSVITQGKARLAKGIPVVIYPEGTRQAPGTLGHFNHGGSMLACQANVPVIAISHNSGNCWPARSWLRLPGTITLRISPPMKTTGIKPKAITGQVEKWVEQHYPG